MKMRALLTCLSVVIILLSTTGSSLGDTIVGWTVDNTSGSLPATFTAWGVTDVPLSRGPDISYHSPDPGTYNSRCRRYGSTWYDGAYLQWGFTSTHPWDLTEVRLNVLTQIPGSGPSGFRVHASFNDESFVEVIPRNTSQFTTRVLTGDLSAYTDITSAVFRLYVRGADDVHNSFKITNHSGLGGQGILVTGVPEPATLSLLAVGVVALIRRRRK